MHSTMIKRLLASSLIFLGVLAMVDAQSIEFGILLDPDDPQTASFVGYPDYSGSSVISSSNFGIRLPAGTATDPVIGAGITILPIGTNSITGVWRAQRIDSGNYPGNAADLQGNDILTVQYVTGSGGNFNSNPGDTIVFFTFRLPGDCMGGDLALLDNGGAIVAAAAMAGLEISNSMSARINNMGITQERYVGNNAATASYLCPLDDAPEAMDDPVMVDEDAGPINIAVLANDDFGRNGPGIGPITITVGTDNGGTATVNNNGTPNDPTDDTIDYNPAPNFFGTETFTYQICDRDGDCDDAVVTVTVNAVNDAPVAANDMYTTDEDMQLMGNVTDNDTDVDGPMVNITLVTDVANGMLMLNPDGTFTYTPDMDYNGPDSFEYSYCDGGTPDLCDTASVMITVAPVNDPPVITKDNMTPDTIFVTVPEDMVDTTCVTVTDVDGDMVTCTFTSPANGTSVQLNDTCVIYTPGLNYFGPDQIIKFADDGNGGRDTVIIIYDVTPVNDAPVAANDMYTTDEDMQLMGNVTDNDTDVDGPMVNITLVTDVANGMLMLNPDGTFTYTPDMDYNGPDSFEYSYCDGGTPDLCDTASVMITVAPVNDPPVITKDNMTPDTIFVTVPEDMVDTTCVTVTDVDGDMVTCTFTSPANGTSVQLNDTCVIYTPGLNYFGPDQIIKFADDGNGGRDTVIIIYNVTPVNDKPVAMDDSYTFNEDETSMGDVSLNDTDIETADADLQFTLLEDVENGMLTFNMDGTFSYTPDAGFNGADSLTYQVCDNDMMMPLCDTAVARINVQTIFIRIQPRVYLQGALVDLNGTFPDMPLMRDDLRQNALIPMTEPYSGLASFAHVGEGGGEMVTSPSVFDDFGPNSIVDWVFIELRNSSTPSVVEATRAALVQRDGDVVDLDGVSPVIFDETLAGTFFVTICHRNHLGVMTESPLSLTPAPQVIDFTDPAQAVFTRNAPIDGFERFTNSDASTPYSALWGGNVNFNGITNYAGQANDSDGIFQAIINDSGNPGQLQSFILNGYTPTDVNMNGQTKYTGLNNDVDFIFNITVPNPVNSSGIVTFGLPEQLPQ
ncbi:Ig-like domain-containing protein [Phaeodactylibacter luteus]|uniref:Tandem-95 repeat protein n=1 Tax=Phaeodactylibacter luteus TaxID=1564516 RepID=A0A5C6RF04_9BACT|nr:Ig-like domain-containing protein [Phaeodactylibacter luteus]TXB59419.1 tandem-95 repeat protein [Phaeodactylibacter luteus]